jgi:hypothetical protein
MQLDLMTYWLQLDTTAGATAPTSTNSTRVPQPQLDSNLFTIQFQPLVLLSAPPSPFLLSFIFFAVTLHDVCI